MQGAVIFSFFIVLSSILLITNAHVDVSDAPTSSANAREQVYIVYLFDKAPRGHTPESYYIKILSSVVGSEKAAKKALVYSYGIVPGFAARLNPDQATILNKRPGVSYVIRDIKYNLDDVDINA